MIETLLPFNRYINLNDSESFKDIPIFIPDFDNELLKCLIEKNDNNITIEDIKYDVCNRTFKIKRDTSVTPETQITLVNFLKFIKYTDTIPKDISDMQKKIIIEKNLRYILLTKFWNIYQTDTNIKMIDDNKAEYTILINYIKKLKYIQYID